MWPLIRLLFGRMSPTDDVIDAEWRREEDPNIPAQACETGVVLATLGPQYVHELGTGDRVSAPQRTTEDGYDEYRTYSKYSTYSSVECLVGFAVSAMAAERTAQ